MLHIVSWNIQGDRGDIGRVARTLRELGDLDVICLQQVTAGPAQGDQFAALGEALSGYAAFSAIANEDRDGQTGNMILTRWPAARVLRHCLPWPLDAAVVTTPRAALEVTLDSPLGALRITCCHLEYFSPRQRMAQVEALRALHVQAHGYACTTPALLVGDFNCLPASPDHARLLAPFDDATPALRDAWQLTHRGERHAPTVGLYDSADPPFTFDYMLACEALAPRVESLAVIGVRGGSQHQPLVLRLA
jgi:endonuclease/exonuclease/phosphatase family metal-dependent hydrolase